MDLSPDFADLLEAFAAERVDYLVIGGFAVAFHGAPRFTKDLDLWVDYSPDNLRCLSRALDRFGAPPSVVESARGARSDEIIWFGKPPLRVDILMECPGLQFGEARAAAETAVWGGLDVPVVGLPDLLTAKAAAGRPQDLVDIQKLSQGS